MIDKFSIDELIIKVMPWGFFLAILYFSFWDKLQINLKDNLDFFYTFLFFCSSFIIWEILQTIAHFLEFIIDIFFKFRRPSKVFLYKNNPVLNDYKRNELIEKLNFTDDEMIIINKNYSNLSILFWKKIKKDEDLLQSIFWKIYTKNSDCEEIKISNRTYLFGRVIMIEFLILSIILLSTCNILYWLFSLLLFLIFLWRSRWLARWLVFKSILLFLKN